MEAKPKSKNILAFELVLASFIVLFQELTLIRWMGSQIRVLAYFPNLILLATFLGLGLGCLRTGKRSCLWFWLPSLLMLTTATYVMSHIVFTQESPSEHLWLLYYDLPKEALVINNIKIPIILSFLMVVISFIPLGQLVGERIKEFKICSTALWGYCWDILGSILGVIAFALIGFSGLFPFYWFLIFLTLGSIFFSNQRWLLLYPIMALIIIVIVAFCERSHAYSPYYALSIKKVANNFHVLTNGSLHQIARNLNRDGQFRNQYEATVLRGYHFPYRVLAKPPKRALVLGAGTGNDVSVLLNQGAEHIDVVEIDPIIVKWGKYHPNKPYSSPKVKIFNTDARSFLNRKGPSYDVIVFGTLDSMTQVSALSNVRLDNFVYTLESIKAASKRLKPDGGLIMYFMVAKDYIDQRFVAILSKVFGKTPFVERKHHWMFNRIYMAGPAFEKIARSNKANLEHFKNISIPTDNWPYLYLKDKSLSKFYIFMIVLIGIIAAISILLCQIKESKNKFHIDIEMFFFGLAFLLLETRAIMEMNLIWGVTWITSAVVFGSILSMVLIATITVQIKPFPFIISVVGLFASLIAIYLIPIHWILGETFAKKLLFSFLFIGTPIYFASICFAQIFKERQNPEHAFGWNVLGAVAGGLLEFFSMWIGMKALLLLVLAAYVIALAKRLFSKNSPY